MTRAAVGQGQGVRFTPTVTCIGGATGAARVWHFGTSTVSGTDIPTVIGRVFSAVGDFDGRPEVTDSQGCSGQSNFLAVHMTAATCAFGDFDHDGDVHLADFAFSQSCFDGPNRVIGDASCRAAADSDGDHDVDMADLAKRQLCFNSFVRQAAQHRCFP